MIRPCVEDILKPLKPFQRRTVDHVFHRLFVAEDGTARFLVADEVGLGKTLVARGIIARAVDHLWEEVERINIIYICSNGSIARANLSKLHIGIGQERSLALPTRLTMLATHLAPRAGARSLANRKLNFVSFTPGTSFNMGHSGGQSPERVVLFRLLEPLFLRLRTALMNLLQCGIHNKDDWRFRLNNNDIALDSGVKERFRDALKNDRSDLLEKLETLLLRFRYYRDDWPEEVRWPRNCLVAELRRLLAEKCVHALEPHLVILDEFQRFKPLLETREDHQDPGAELAQYLFRTKTPEDEPVRILLLSATPYKFFTTDSEMADEDHYEDFLSTTRFLLNGNEGRVEDVQRRLSSFGTALRRAANDDPTQIEPVAAAKSEVEAGLCSIMARTERVSASDARDAMVKEFKRHGRLIPADVKQYLAADALFRTVRGQDPMRFWKSAPYLAHFMHGYKFNRLLDEAIELSPRKVGEVLKRHAAAFMKSDAVRRWKTFDPANPKLRTMVSDLLDKGMWRLLWIPPTLPYWPLEGPFEDKQAFTKTLLFSAWNVVPDVVSAMLSYEAERRMVGKGRVEKYDRPAEQQGPLLRFTQSAAGKRSRHRLLWFLLPCLRLADQAHPLGAPAGKDRRDWVRGQVEAILAELRDPQDRPVDERWEWAAPLLLDPKLRDFLQEWRDGCAWKHNRVRTKDELESLCQGKSFPKPNPEQFDAYLDDLLNFDPAGLGRRPPGLTKLITDAALGSPAILASRCLKMLGVDDTVRRRLATGMAEAFWHLFNQPAVISLINQLPAAAKTSTSGAPYWHRVLRYCQQGNLQAVLDEQWHLLWEQNTWSQEADPQKTAARCARQFVQAAPPTRSRVHARFFRSQHDNTIETEEVRIRTVFALRFGHLPTEDGQNLSQDAVQAAFNSPFRPFVLTSTSIGQEGLDFHPWCHRLMHWDLPGNPVDLEQREGRVHRYKGHAVRRNVAAAHGQIALSDWSPGTDLWARMFEIADETARAKGESDLVPHWIAPGNCRVQRHVPLLPYTREVEVFQWLKRQLAAYRVVIGQPRQEELVTLLDQAEIDVGQLAAWTVDLSPPRPISNTSNPRKW